MSLSAQPTEEQSTQPVPRESAPLALVQNPQANQWQWMTPGTAQFLRYSLVILAFAWLVIIGATWNS